VVDKKICKNCIFYDDFYCDRDGEFVSWDNDCTSFVEKDSDSEIIR
jgi:hypothetical protein